MNFSGISNETFLGRALRLPLRMIPNSMPMRVLQGPLRGKKWIAGSSNHGCWLGTYEYSKQKAFAAAVRRGDVVYDLGANVGFYSLLACVLAGPEGRVFSFEPVPRNVALLRKHLRMNRATNCTVIEAAVGGSEGIAQFDVSSEASMGHLTGEAESGLAVRVVTLDGMVSSGQLPPPNVVKCDIEGAEFDLLDSPRFGETVSQTNQICIEFHHRWREFGKLKTVAAVARLRKLGFVVAWVSPSNEEALLVRTGVFA